MTANLYIIAAGKGSRMGGNIPKALVPITDKPCLTTTLQQIGHKFSKVFIVTNKDVQPAWDEYYSNLHKTFPELMSNVTNVPINSGLGDGHATKWGLYSASVHDEINNVETNNNIVVCWGDVFFQHAEIIDELLSIKMEDNIAGIAPAVLEANPYVSLLVDEKMKCMAADFSKYGENHPTGFHDQSIFRFNRSAVWQALNALDCAFWKNGRYITPGGELSLLHAFHYLYNARIPLKVYETSYPTLSFNTPEEVAAIQAEIHEKWKQSKSNT